MHSQQHSGPSGATQRDVLTPFFTFAVILQAGPLLPSLSPGGGEVCTERRDWEPGAGTGFPSGALGPGSASLDLGLALKSENPGVCRGGHQVRWWRCMHFSNWEACGFRQGKMGFPPPQGYPLLSVSPASLGRCRGQHSWWRNSFATQDPRGQSQVSHAKLPPLGDFSDLTQDLPRNISTLDLGLTCLHPQI